MSARSGSRAFSGGGGGGVPAGRPPVTLTDAATIVTDASVSSQFRVTVAGNRTLGNPTGAYDTQVIMWHVKQDAVGGWTIALGSKFRFGTDLTSVALSATPSVTDKLTAQYNAVDDRFDVISFVRGF